MAYGELHAACAFVRSLLFVLTLQCLTVPPSSNWISRCDRSQEKPRQASRRSPSSTSLCAVGCWKQQELFLCLENSVMHRQLLFSAEQPSLTSSVLPLALEAVASALIFWILFFFKSLSSALSQLAFCIACYLAAAWQSPACYSHAARIRHKRGRDAGEGVSHLSWQRLDPNQHIDSDWNSKYWERDLSDLATKTHNKPGHWLNRLAL